MKNQYLETFHNDAIGRDVGEAIDLLSAEAGGALPGLIIDIRNNGGGFLDASVDVSGHFLNGGEVLSVRGRQKDDISRYHAKRGEKVPGTPIVVLINGNSASASEIVAGALQDRGRALVVGTPSFGKGSVQSVYPLRGGSEGFCPAYSFVQLVQMRIAWIGGIGRGGKVALIHDCMTKVFKRFDKTRSAIAIRAHQTAATTFAAINGRAN